MFNMSRGGIVGRDSKVDVAMFLGWVRIVSGRCSEVCVAMLGFGRFHHPFGNVKNVLCVFKGECSEDAHPRFSECH